MIHLQDINKTYQGAQPLHVLKGNLRITVHGPMNGVDGIIDGFIHAFRPVRHIDTALQLLRLVDTCQLFQLCDQLSGFASGNESGGLYRIH